MSVINGILIRRMDMNVEIGKFYRHFKGKLYQVLNIATDSETGEKMVVYQALYGSFEVYVRGYNSFTEMLDKNKYPAAVQLYRFVEVKKEALSLQGEETEPNMTGSDCSGNTEGASSGAEGPATSQLPAYASTAEGSVDPVLVMFLEADGSEAKYEVLKEHYLEISERTMTNIEVSLDVVSNSKEMDDRIRDVMGVLRTRARYENTRLR